MLVPEHLIGVHLNMLFTRVPPDAGELTEVEQARVAAAERFRATGSGYGAIQSTRPQTIAYGLTDSPVGQLAWIAEKFGEWTDDGLPDQAVDRDQLLANVTVYWLTATAGSSARLYYEAAQPARGASRALNCAHRRGRLSPGDRSAIRRFAELTNNIVQWTEFDRGGHFAAMEAPDLLVSDVREFFRRFR